jgi:hypothetical protein
VFTLPIQDDRYYPLNIVPAHYDSHFTGDGMSTLNPMVHFKKNGFYIARNLIDSKDVLAVREGLHKSFNDQLIHLGVGPEKDIFTSMQCLHDKDIGRYRKLVGGLWRKIEIYNLMHHRHILKLLADKFGWLDIFVPGGQVIHIMADELKIPGGYFGHLPHQDFPSVQGSLDGVVVWLPLVDVDRDNYPLEVSPGSHMAGLLSSKKNSDATWEVVDDRCREETYIPIEVGVGDVVFMSLFTAHRSSLRGTTGRLRLAISTRFDNADEATFIERCYPTAYVRSVHREQYFPEFPTVEQIAKVFQGTP